VWQGRFHCKAALKGALMGLCGTVAFTAKGPDFITRQVQRILKCASINVFECGRVVDQGREGCCLDEEINPCSKEYESQGFFNQGKQA
jgi:hypothetical protein